MKNLFWLFLSFAPFFTIANAPKKIFFVHSYNHHTFGWTQSITQGFVQGLSKRFLQRNQDYVLIEATLDAFTHTTHNALAQRAITIQQRIAQEQPDLIVTTDDDALIYVGLHIDNIPVIFSGLNKPMSYYTKHPKIDSLSTPNHNITGVYQTTHLKETLQLIKSVKPTAKNFALISAESTTATGVLSQFKEMQGLPLTKEYTLISNDFAQWQQKIMEWQNKVDSIVVISANIVRDSDGRLLATHEVFNWINNNNQLPTATFWDSLVNQGLLLSMADTGSQQGWHIASYTHQILTGKPPGQLPIVTPKIGVPTINVTVLKQLNITLPPDVVSTFVFSGKAYQ